MAKLDIERDIKINRYQSVVCGDNEVGDIFDYYVKRYGISNLYFILSFVYNLGKIHAKREERARRKASMMKG